MRLFSSERGAALLMVVLIVALLTAVIVDFSFQTRLDARLAANVRDNTIAAAIARSGYEAALSLVLDDTDIEEAEGATLTGTGTSAVSELLQGQRDKAAGGAAGIDSLQESWARMDLLEIPLAPNQELRVEVTDLSGRINLNAIISRSEAGTEKLNQPLFEQLVTLIEQARDEIEGEGAPGADDLSAEDVAYAIADWVDADEVRLSDGSFEDQYYNSLPQAYSSKNGPFDSAAELQLVQGVDDALYAALADAVTVYPFTGGGQINVNTAPEGVLRSIRYRENQATASPEPLSDDSIERILEARQAGLAIASKKEFQELLGLEPTSAITPDLVFASNFFMIRAAGRVDESTARLEVVVERGEGPPRVLYWRSE